jgi:hypothetical protein
MLPPVRDVPALRAQVPMFQVTEPARTIAFYEQLGFAVGNCTEGRDGRVNWVWLERDTVSLMFTRVDEPIDPGAQGAVIYLFTDHLHALHGLLTSQGLDVSEIFTTDYSPDGEFCVTDPDGWRILISHA